MIVSKTKLMKKLLLFIAATGILQVNAQNITPEFDYVPGNKITKPEQRMSRWVVDVNLMGGLLNQNITTTNLAGNYSNALNTKIGEVKFDKGSSFGVEAQLGYFFDKKQHWGVGTGIMYMAQRGNISLDQFHVEYLSTDVFRNTFRQVLTSNRINESLRMSSWNIPLVLKYQKKITNKVGFTADAGLLFNVGVKSNYTADASFDYEAIYKYTTTGNSSVAVFDNSPVPGSSDLLITKSRYLSDHSSGDVQYYFNQLRSQGYNVGLGVQPKNTTGSVSYNGLSVGAIVRPAISISLCDNAALNLGVYYIYQDMQPSASGSYRITNKLGEYSSLTNGVTEAKNHNYGVNVGVRFYFNRKKEEAQVPVAPEEPAEEEPAPVASPYVQPEPEESIDISTPILFDLNRTTIKPESKPIIEAAAKEVAESKSTLVVHGYTDITGTALYNKALSKKRANAVKNSLRKQGVTGKIKTVGHGTKNPVASNKTSEGRARNRRAVIKIK